MSGDLQTAKQSVDNCVSDGVYGSGDGQFAKRCFIEGSGVNPGLKPGSVGRTRGIWEGFLA